MTELEFELDKTVFEIKKRKAKLVALQFPEGLKTKSQKIAQEIENKTGCTTVSIIDPCFGACMLADEQAKKLGANLLVHFGHSRFYKESIPAVFVPVHYKISDLQIKKTAQKISEELELKNKKNNSKIKKIGLAGTVQYLTALPKIKTELEKLGFIAKIGKGHGVLDGQVLGCNYSAANRIISEVDCTVYVGDGQFHPLGIVFATNKPVFTIEPFEQKFREITEEKDRFIRKRLVLIGSVLDAHSFGILVSTKKGQFGIQKALLAKKTIEKQGKIAIILAGDLVKPEYVLGIKVDCMVNTACPRIATDDYNNYSAPVISLDELPYALGIKTLEEFEKQKQV
ncbi:MAG: diphthamide biosynthesis enzyme Dph2 [Candidatus Micrarchaeota archaeon]